MALHLWGGVVSLSDWTVHFYKAAAGVSLPDMWYWRAENQATGEELRAEFGTYDRPSCEADALDTLRTGRPDVVNGDWLLRAVEGRAR